MDPSGKTLPPKRRKKTLGAFEKKNDRVQTGSRKYFHNLLKSRKKFSYELEAIEINEYNRRREKYEYESPICARFMMDNSII